MSDVASDETKILSLPPRLFEPDGKENLPPPPPAVNGAIVGGDHSQEVKVDPSEEGMVEPSTLLFAGNLVAAYGRKPLLSKEQINVLSARLESVPEGHLAVVRTKLIDLAITAPTGKKGVEMALRVISGAVGLFP